MMRHIEKVEDVIIGILEKISPSFSGLVGKYKVYIRYIFSGGTAAAVDLGLLAFFKEVFGFHYLLAAILAFIIAFVVSFILQKFWTFGDNSLEGVHRQAGLYLGIALLNLAVNTLLMYTFVDLFHIWYLLSQVLASGLIAVTSFFIYRRFVFKAPTASGNLINDK